MSVAEFAAGACTFYGADYRPLVRNLHALVDSELERNGIQTKPVRKEDLLWYVSLTEH
jgi:hypothetical protein